MNIKLIFLFLMPFYSCGQSIKKMSTDKINSLLCHKWNIAENSDSWTTTKDSHLKVESVFPSELSSTVEFISDGSVKFDITKGSWKYNKKGNQLVLELNTKLVNYTIQKLTEKGMLLENNENGSAKKISLWREE